MRWAYIVAPIDSGTVNAGNLSTIGWTSSTNKVSSIGTATIDESDSLVDVTGRDVDPVPVLAGNAVLDAETALVEPTRLQWGRITRSGERDRVITDWDVC